MNCPLLLLGDLVHKAESHWHCASCSHVQGNTVSLELNKYPMDKQVHATCLPAEPLRDLNMLIYVVNLQNWAVAQNTLAMSLTLNLSIVEYIDLKERWPVGSTGI